MKTRIISASVLIAVVLGFIVLGKTVSPLFMTAFILAAAVIGIYELLHNALKINVKAANAVACIYVGLEIVLLDKNVAIELIKVFNSTKMGSGVLVAVSALSLRLLTAVYFVVAVAIILIKHKEFNIASILGFSAMPLFLGYAFSTLGSIINHNNGIYYLVLLLNFSSICDTGAYFIGCNFGRHKLCPEISPKKTVEGALGGIVSSLIASIIIVVCFGRLETAAAVLILTIPMCILGMFGDLFASIIKRNVGLKDYGNLIPGHGGILDRFDSMLLIAPVLYIFINLGVL